MIKKIKFISLFIATALVGVALFYACKKEDNLAKNNLSEEVLKSQITDSSFEHLAIEAHNIIVDFLLRSKDALDNYPVAFERICKEGNLEELITLIGYNQDDDVAKSMRLIEIVEESATIFGNEEVPKGLNSCSSCSIESFSQILMDLDYDTQKAPQGGWGDLLMCLAACAFDCMPLIEFPPLYATCTVACTALCYYLYNCRTVAYVYVEA
jgi:hypothetical protein